jgi:hypothetical protein
VISCWFSSFLPSISVVIERRSRVIQTAKSAHGYSIEFFFFSVMEGPKDKLFGYTKYKCLKARHVYVECGY